MTTSSINRRSTTLATLAAIGLAGTISAVTLDSAQAFLGDPPAVVGHSVRTDSFDLDHACFITPPTWNESLDGPLPRCSTDHS